MRRIALWISLALGIAALPAAASAAPGPGALQSVEVAVTYAHGALAVFEIAAATPGSTVALPLPPGAKNVKIQGGRYTLTHPSPSGRVALVTTPQGSAQATFQLSAPARGDYVFTWRTPASIRQVLLLAGPKVHPSGLGMAPFQLGGQVQLGGEMLTSFRASGIPAGFTLRWPFEIGVPGQPLADVFAAIGVGLPALAILLGLWRILGVRRGKAA